MKTSSILTAGIYLAGAAIAAPTPNDPRASGPVTAPTVPIGSSKAPFAKPDGRLFNYDGTGPRYMAGTNAWWLSHIMEDNYVDDVLRIISQVGYSYSIPI